MEATQEVEAEVLVGQEVAAEATKPAPVAILPVVLEETVSTEAVAAVVVVTILHTALGAVAAV